MVEIDVEVHEHIFYAAIQLASHPKDFEKRRNILEFVNVLQSYFTWPKRYLSVKELPFYMGVSAENNKDPPEEQPLSRNWKKDKYIAKELAKNIQ